MSVADLDSWFAPAIAVALVPALTFLAASAYTWIAEQMSDGDRNPRLVSQWPSLLLQAAVGCIVLTLEVLNARSATQAQMQQASYGLVMGIALAALTWGLLWKRSQILDGSLPDLRSNPLPLNKAQQLEATDRLSLAVSFLLAFIISLVIYQTFFPLAAAT